MAIKFLGRELDWLPAWGSPTRHPKTQRQELPALRSLRLWGSHEVTSTTVYKPMLVTRPAHGQGGRGSDFPLGGGINSLPCEGKDSAASKQSTTRGFWQVTGDGAGWAREDKGSPA